MADREMGYIDHINELRRRLVWTVAVFVLAAVVAFTFSAELLDYFTGPTREGLVVNRPSEAFYAHLQVSVAAAFAVVVPLLLYQLLAFIFPGLTRSERRWVLIAVPPVLLLFIAGMCFAWFVVVPVIYRFFMGFTSESLQPFISVGNYISFVTGIVVPFGVVFELPVLVALLTGIGIVSPELLARYRKFAILIIFVLAAFLTPPDPVSQSLLALPLLALYEASLGVAKIVWRRRQAAIARQQAELAELEAAEAAAETATAAAQEGAVEGAREDAPEDAAQVVDDRAEDDKQQGGRGEDPGNG